MSKTTIIKEIAVNLVENKKTMTFDQLTKHLNDTGHMTNYGTEYVGKRGIAKIKSSV